MFRLRHYVTPTDSRLYDERNFYKSFVQDVSCARKMIVIESPFITSRRLDMLYPVLSSAVRQGVNIVVNTRNPDSHDAVMWQQTVNGIETLQSLGITVLFTGNLHRKIAIIDNSVLWEGSLNILSQSDSCEMMRRSVSPELVKQMINFTKLNKWYTRV